MSMSTFFVVVVVFSGIDFSSSGRFFMFCPGLHFLHSTLLPVDVFSFTTFFLSRRFLSSAFIPVLIFSINGSSHSAFFFISTLCLLIFFAYRCFYVDILSVNQINHNTATLLSSWSQATCYFVFTL
jgi:hypothetical protein